MNNWFSDIIVNLFYFFKDVLFPKKITEMEYIPLPTPLPVTPSPILPRQKLYLSAISFLSTDASPQDFASDDLGCAESFSDIYKDAFGFYPGNSPKASLSTIALNKIFLEHPERFKPTTEIKKGIIIIVVTGTSILGWRIGHIGICDNDGVISNTSKDGILRKNYSFPEWHHHFETLNGFKSHLFEPI